MSEPAYNGISDGEEEVECDILADENPDLETNNGGEVRKNLFDDFKELGTEISSTNEREYMKAFLRIRPFTEEEKGSEENQNCMEIEGDSAILLNAPKDSFTAKNEKRGREVTHRFTFSRVFAPETTQKEFFDDTSLGLVKDFVDGQNCLIFTYGVTNSGKTYTIQGTPSDGGVLPRTLDVLFNSVEGKEYSRNNLKPRYFCDVSRLDEKQEHMEIALRNGLIMSLNKEHFDLNSFLELENSELSKLAECEDSGLHVTSDHVMDNSNGDNDSRTADNTTISVDTQGDIRFSVWVSFAEIYNEQIYDLLEQCPDGQGKKRTTLKLGDDKHGNPYVKGLREVCVSNADEAYKILRVGKKNQRIASTKLNHSSSRSHCIFTIKVLRVMNVDNPHVARVSRLSFVDLAGSERYSKTQSTGDRLKEAGNINTSLMTLGKCLDYLRYNQSHINKPQCIPFRESKLTRLFQGFFCGKGKASMVVNINQCASTFDETYHALKFSAIAKQVSTRVIKPVDIVQPLPEKSFRASFAFNALSRSVRKSIMWENGGYDTPAGGKCFAEEGEEEEEEEEEEGTSESTYQQQLVQLVKVLQEQLIAEKKEKASMELKIRDEVCSEMQEQLVDIENAYSERYQEDINAIEKKCDRRIELLTQSVKKSRKRPRVDRVTEDEEELLRDEKKKNKNVTSKLEEAKQMIDQLNKEKKELEQMLDEAGETFAEKDAIIKRQTEELELLKMAASDDEKRCSAQDEALTELRTCLQTASKEVEIARIKLDQRDRQMMEKAKEIEEFKRILREHEGFLVRMRREKEDGPPLQNYSLRARPKRQLPQETTRTTKTRKMATKRPRHETLL